MQRSPDDSLATTARLAGKCAIPSDFFSGRPTEPPLFTSNILCFCKKSAKELIRGSQERRRHHQRHVLICALMGSGTIRVDGAEQSLAPGEALMVFPLELHYYTHFAQERIVWLYITFDVPEDPRISRFKGAGPLSLGEEGLRALREVLEAWFEESSGALLPAATALLLSQLCLHLEAGDFEGGLPVHNRDDLLRKINHFILETRYRQIPTRELALSLGISPAQLRSWFRNETGLTLARHLQELRMQKASALLAEGNRRISEIAEFCGFESVYSFSRAFRKARGLSPSNYRKQVAKRGH